MVVMTGLLRVLAFARTGLGGDELGASALIIRLTSAGPRMSV